MSTPASQKPISIHIPPDLQHLAIPLQKFLEQHPSYSCLAVGAFIFSISNGDSPSDHPRLLQIQRAASERAFPNLWEVPGGSSELTDPTILHSVAREVFEETGLHLTRFIRQIGSGTEFVTGPKSRPKPWLKLHFEIEVAELGRALLEGLSSCVHGDHGQQSGAEQSGRLRNVISGTSIEVFLDPTEHQDYRWVSEDDVRTDRYNGGSHRLVSDDQKRVTLEAFNLHREGFEQLRALIGSAGNLPTSI